MVPPVIITRTWRSLRLDEDTSFPLVVILEVLLCCRVRSQETRDYFLTVYGTVREQEEWTERLLQERYMAYYRLMACSQTIVMYKLS